MVLHLLLLGNLTILVEKYSNKENQHALWF